MVDFAYSNIANLGILMAQQKGEEPKNKLIEVEVQSKHYRPVSSKWLANGVVMVDGKPVYWKAARQYAKWEIEPSAYEGWDLEGEAREEAMGMIVQALQENRKFLSQLDVQEQEQKPYEEGPRIELAHGGGGTLMHELIEKVILKYLSNPQLARLDDGAVLPSQSGRLVITTDTFVVKPLFFKGGDIGRLAVCGTVNNLSVSGAKPLAVSLGLVLEENLAISTLGEVLASVRKAADEAKVKVVTGDTRVVERGKVDGMFINTTGIGAVFPRVRADLSRARPGDAVLLSGTLGNHGMAVLCERESLSFGKTIESDVAPVNSLTAKLVEAKVPIRCMKDPTRGGVAAALNRIAHSSRVQIEMDEAALPVRDDVSDACEMLGLDPLYIANQGRILLVSSRRGAGKALKTMQQHPLGTDAAIIGQVKEGIPGRVTIKTRTGGSRIIDMPYGEQLPRVC
jgi:hydrogenase expression/formation protein HypE